MITVKRFGDGWDMATVYEVTSNIRDEDKYEFAAAGVQDIPTDTARYIQAAHDPWMVFYRGEPVFIFGTLKASNNVHCLFGFGTDKTKRIIPHLTKWGKEFWIPMLFEDQGARRVEVRVPVASTHAVNWLTGHGMNIETIINHGSATGEPLFQLAYTVDDYYRLKAEQDNASNVQDQRTYAPGPDPGSH